MKLRVVLDTNIVVSALLKPQGLEDLVFRLCLSGQFQFFVSPPVLAEYNKTLPKPKLKLTSIEIEQALKELRRIGQMVHPTSTVSISGHEQDNRFLECAEAAAADFLITGNLKHFPKQWKITRVVRARDFLEQALPLKK